MQSTAAVAATELDEIVLTHPKILKYFDAHENMDPEQTVLFFIEMLEKFGENINESINASINSQILANLNENRTMLSSINDSINKVNTNIINTLFIKMMEIKKEYIDDIKTIISSNTTENLFSILEKNNSHLIDKTSLLLNDAIPKSNSGLYAHIDEKIRAFQAENERILRTVDTQNLKEYITAVDTKFTQMLQSMQQPQEKLYGEMNEFLNKYRVSNFKGQFGEMQLSQLLNQMFPTGEISDTRGITASGDFLVKREGMPTIMFENKDYTENVYISEIRKFVRDVENIKTHAIFLSQRSGIASKSNYQIDVHNGNILVYVHNVEYSREKIQIAVDIIDNLYTKLEEFYENQNSETISKEVLEEINREYQNFATQKDNLTCLFKDHLKKSMTQLEELKFPSLERLLSTRFSSTTNVTKHSNLFKCEFCNVYVCTTKKSLSAHQRGCKSKKGGGAAGAAAESHDRGRGGGGGFKDMDEDSD